MTRRWLCDVASSHDEFKSSYISDVIAPRTDRADSRAARRQQNIDDGLAESRIMKRNTFSAESTGCRS